MIDKMLTIRIAPVKSISRFTVRNVRTISCWCEEVFSGDKDLVESRFQAHIEDDHREVYSPPTEFPPLEWPS